MVPEHAAGLVRVAVTQNDQQYEGSLVFEYEDVAPTSIEPRTGPVRGGTTVRLRGASVHSAAHGVAFGVAQRAFCKFAGLDVVDASFEGEGSVRCTTPPALRPGAVAMALVHGDAVLEASVSFEYHVEMAVHSVEPATGVVTGGTLVRVKGLGFDPNIALVVRVGTRALVSARVLGPTMLECMTPAQALSGLLALEVSRKDNSADFTGDEVLFEYQTALRLDELAPSRGPRSGGTAVVIAGSGFSQRSAALAYTQVSL